jgi:hypothetical protein
VGVTREVGEAGVGMGAEVLWGGVVLAEAETGPGDARSGQLLGSSRRNDDRGELVMGAWRRS